MFRMDEIDMLKKEIRISIFKSAEGAVQNLSIGHAVRIGAATDRWLVAKAGLAKGREVLYRHLYYAKSATLSEVAGKVVITAFERRNENRQSGRWTCSPTWHLKPLQGGTIALETWQENSVPGGEYT